MSSKTFLRMISGLMIAAAILALEVSHAQADVPSNDNFTNATVISSISIDESRIILRQRLKIRAHS